MEETFAPKTVYFDLETTGTDVARDRIVQIALRINEYKTDTGKETFQFVQLVNPTINIPAAASDVHGITDEMVKDSPQFGEIAKLVYDLINEPDIIVCGFNIIRFDLPLLAEELLRVNPEFVLRTDMKIADAQVVYHTFEPRTLSAALKFYTGVVHEEAHDALGDVDATENVLHSQIIKYDLSFEELHKISTRDKEIVDWAGNFVKDEFGDIVFAFGKHKGRRADLEKGYLKWMLGADFPETTKAVCRKLAEVNNAAAPVTRAATLKAGVI